MDFESKKISERPAIILSGFSSPIGRYVREAFAGEKVIDFDSGGIPEERDPSSTMFIYIAQGDDCSTRLLRAARELENAGPMYVVVISTAEVYPTNAQNPAETHLLAPDTEVGRRTLEAEKILGEVTALTDGVSIILRPAMIFGTDVDGPAQNLFRRVAGGKFFAVRGVPALRSIVCALDIGRICAELFRHREQLNTAIYNVADGIDHPISELATAMTANMGAAKRPVVLLPKMASIIARICNRIPALRPLWGTKAIEQLTADRTVDTSALRELLPDFKFFNTADVLSRTAADYPYQTK